ncbi:transmembrane protein 201-like [Physella acuta]|uniref:transmembrane protein 201-like n=1 Tax=Physella acuta TaxID=109671 RepID=UPI0027DC20D1|nr:transmembrane protein 201-like [Physella acuta]
MNFIMRWVKNDNMPPSEIRVNCWFCNEDSIVKAEDKDSWTCRNCEQYNGFTEDGDYNKPITEQYQINDSVGVSTRTPAEMNEKESLLCADCGQNQVIKVRQLAAFVPFSEVDYDDEVEMYRDYLEKVYALCSVCQERVQDFIRKQDLTLINDMSADQQKLVDSLHEKSLYPGHSDHVQHSNVRFYQQVTSKILFIMCALSSFLLLVFNIRLYLGSTSADYSSNPWLDDINKVFFSHVSVHLVLDMSGKAVLTGAIFCLVGLALSGKHSLYPEDTLHLLLWLVTVVTAFNLVDVSLPVTLGLNVLTLFVVIICCIRDRRPRNITVESLQRKQISPASSPIEPRPEYVREFSAEEASLKSSPSVQASESGGKDQITPHFEEVRQNLETFTFGLGKRTGSNSSIWSLPLIVSAPGSAPRPVSTCPAAVVAADSSTDHVKQSRTIISPSRLGFISLDVKEKRTSSSPFSSLAQDISTNLPENLSPSYNHPMNSLPRYNDQYHGYPPPLNIAPVQRSGSGNNSVMMEVKRRKNNMTTEETFFLKPKTRVVRKSQRLAMAGRSPKPWSLQKSLSCTNAYDKENITRAAGKAVNPLVASACSNDNTAGTFMNSKVNLHCGDGSGQHGAPKGNVRLNPSLRFEKDFSDDEGEIELRQSLEGKSKNIAGSNGQEFSFRWTVIGLIIGVSVTANIFMIYLMNLKAG